MPAIDLKVGDQIELENIRYQVDGFPVGKKGKEFNLRSLEDNCTRLITAEEILVACKSSRFRKVVDPFGYLPESRHKLLEQSLDTLPDHLQQETLRRYDYVSAFYKQDRRVKSKSALKIMIDQVAKANGDTHPPSPRTLLRWISFWEFSGGNTRALTPDIQARGNRKNRFQKDVKSIVAAEIERIWIRPEEITVDDVHAHVHNAVKELNKANATNEKIKGPSKRSIYRMIAQLTGYTITERKQGKRKADIQFRSVSLGPEPERPLEEVEIDHHLLDLNVLDDKYGNLLGRPWLTLALDRATRMIVGYHLGLAAPNYTSVMECLRHAMAQKNLDRHRPFVRHDWDVFGKIERIVLDNGKEFHCNSLKTACSDMNIGITYTAKRSPWLKGKVERFFGTLETGLVHKIPGTTFSNPMARGDYLSGERACLTFSEAEQAICKFIVDIYSNNLHTGINAIPRLRWEELTDRYPILPVTPEDLDVLLHHVLYVDVSAKGIRMYGLLYQDTYKLAELRSIPGIDKYLFTVKLDPADLSAIRVLDPVTRTYSIIQSSDPKYTEGLTLDQHLRIRDYTRAKLKRTITIDDLCQSKAELFAFIDERASKRGISKTGRVFIGDPKKRATRPSRNQAPPDQASNASDTENIPTVKIEHDNTTTEHFIDDDDNEFGEIEATFGISAIYRK